VLRGEEVLGSDEEAAYQACNIALKKVEETELVWDIVLVEQAGGLIGYETR
jgi:hypothetical protein